jgi:hypothetical protein
LKIDKTEKTKEKRQRETAKLGHQKQHQNNNGSIRKLTAMIEHFRAVL